MIPVIIIGTSAYSRKLKHLVEREYNPYAVSHGGEELRVMAYFDMFSEDGREEILDRVLVLDRKTLGPVMESGEIGALLLPQQPKLDIQYLMYFLRSIHVYQEMTYFVSRELLEKNDYDESDIENLMVPYADVPYLPYVEFHIEDSCNMNCKACEHYSPLVKMSPETRMDFEEMKRDFIRLKTLIREVGRIRILGGEPLLNPELPKYLYMIREVYPEADIFVVTNAILLHRLSEDAYEAMREVNGTFMISFYPPLEGKIEEIEAVPKSKGIRVMRTPLIKEFSLRQNLDGHIDPGEAYDSCFQSSCINVYRGHIATCMLPFMTHYFNETFHEDIPEDGAIDLYEEGLTTRSLKEKLETPLRRCAYCGKPKNVPWKQASKEPNLRDFILMDE